MLLLYIDGQDNIYPISNFLTNAASPTKPPPNYSNKSPTEFPPKPILFAMCSYNPISIRLRNLLGQTTMQMRREMSASHGIFIYLFFLGYREEEE